MSSASLDLTDLAFVHLHARRALAAYDPEDQIRREFAEVSALHVATLAHVELQVIVAIDRAAGEQWVAIRGTDNLANLLHDMIYMQDEHTPLGIPLDAGFEECGDAARVYAEPLLESGLRTFVTGHSLGGAAALVLALYLHEHDHHELAACVTFGQPKITNEFGARLISRLPLLRVVHDEDPMPRVPPTTLLTSLHGGYRQAGTELRITSAGASVIDDNAVAASRVDAFWAQLFHERLSDHHMERYLECIEQLMALKED